MTGYAIVLLNDMLKEIGEDSAKTILSSFSCPLNKDVERFLKTSAIEFAKQNIAPTHLVFCSYRGEAVLVGYFTLTTKSIVVQKRSLSKTLQKRINKFATTSPNRQAYILPAPLIAQLGKNFNSNYNALITGDELLKIAVDKVKSSQQIIGGKIVYLECEDKEKLINFYSDNGFVNFGKRDLDGDELSDFCGKYLVQMLKYL